MNQQTDQKPRPPYFAYFITNLWWGIPLLGMLVYGFMEYPFLDILLTVALVIGAVVIVAAIGYGFVLFGDFYHDQHYKIVEYRRKRRRGGY